MEIISVPVEGGLSTLVLFLTIVLRSFSIKFWVLWLVLASAYYVSTLREAFYLGHVPWRYPTAIEYAELFVFYLFWMTLLAAPTIAIYLAVYIGFRRRVADIRVLRASLVCVAIIGMWITSQAWKGHLNQARDLSVFTGIALLLGFILIRPWKSPRIVVEEEQAQ